MSDPDPSEPEDQFESLTESEFGGGIPETPETAAALPGVVGIGDAADEFRNVIDIGDRYLGMATIGQGEKLAIADAVGDYVPLGIDCIAQTVNQLVADGLTPVCYTNHLSLADPAEDLAAQLARGLAEGAEQAGILLLGGQLSHTPAEVATRDVVGTAAGVATETELFPGSAATGDRLVGFPASGLHPSTVQSAVQAVSHEYDLEDPFPGPDHSTVAAALLEPTRLFTSLLDPLREATVHAAVDLAAGGWTRLARMGEDRYSITEPLDPPPVFEFIQETSGHSLETLYETFPMGTGFVLAAPESAASAIVAETDGLIIGAVEQGSGVRIRGMERGEADD